MGTPFFGKAITTNSFAADHDPLFPQTELRAIRIISVSVDVLQYYKCGDHIWIYITYIIYRKKLST